MGMGGSEYVGGGGFYCDLKKLVSKLVELDLIADLSTISIFL